MTSENSSSSSSNVDPASMTTEPSAAEARTLADAAEGSQTSTETSPSQRIRIGSQRFEQPRQEPAKEPHEPAAAAQDASTPQPAPAVSAPVVSAPAAEVASPNAAAADVPSGAIAATGTESTPTDTGSGKPGDGRDRPRGPRPPRDKRPPKRVFEEPLHVRQVPLPSLREDLPDDLAAELDAALEGVSLTDTISQSVPAGAGQIYEPDTMRPGRVLSHNEDTVFVDLGGKDQGVAPLAAFDTPPEPGTLLEFRVTKYNPEDGLYNLAVPGKVLPTADWGDISEGALVEVTVTGHNKGGLECQINQIRGFIPASQVSLYRVEDFSSMVGERLLCVVTEANPSRRNLVLSRRGVLEREKNEKRQQLLESMVPGKICEGIVRSLRDFGAFVDLGGIDGMIHISQMSWNRVKHPQDVLQVGQKVSVKVQKVDPDTGKIGLTLRDMIENPWSKVEDKYSTGSKVKGTVTKLMEFGAFIQLEPGIEGLVHISELEHHRVFRVSDVLQPGQEVEAQVLSVDQAKQRISLSLKAVKAKPQAASKEKEEPLEEEPVAAEAAKSNRPKLTNLKGGRDKASGGDRFGLNW